MLHFKPSLEVLPSTLLTHKRLLCGEFAFTLVKCWEVLHSRLNNTMDLIHRFICAILKCKQTSRILVPRGMNNGFGREESFFQVHGKTCPNRKNQPVGWVEHSETQQLEEKPPGHDLRSSTNRTA